LASSSTVPPESARSQRPGFARGEWPWTGNEVAHAWCQLVPSSCRELVLRTAALLVGTVSDQASGPVPKYAKGLSEIDSSWIGMLAALPDPWTYPVCRRIARTHALCATRRRGMPNRQDQMSRGARGTILGDAARRFNRRITMSPRSRPVCHVDFAIGGVELVDKLI
jgi:hypothetical protein